MKYTSPTVSYVGPDINECSEVNTVWTTAIASSVTGAVAGAVVSSMLAA